MATEHQLEQTAVWVFGYGSLLWKQEFPYEEKLVGQLKGYVRRFWQASFIHRGTKEKPGRVVTLIEADSKDACTWGIAFKVEPSAVPEVIAQLNQRETSAYITREVTFFPKLTTQPFSVLVYIGTESSFGYLGPAPIDNIAEQILHCSGKSGTNAEYVLKLASTMREIAPNVQDEHLFSLEKKILILLRDDSQDSRDTTEQRDEDLLAEIKKDS